MDNKNDHQLSDDYIDKILEETESTGDVLDDLTPDPTPSTENKTKTASVHEAENSPKPGQTQGTTRRHKGRTLRRLRD